MRIESRHIRLWALGLLALFVAYYTSVVVFAHVHMVGGVMIVHSHPFTHQHSHTAGQALSLHFMSVFHSLDTEDTCCVSPEWGILDTFLYERNTFRALGVHAACIRLRAPPVCLFIA